MKISIIVLNYNGIKDTLLCLESINKLNRSKVTTEIIVVDNNSKDGSQAILSKVVNIHLIQNQSNLGYAAGNNIGIRYALKNNSDFLLLLNNDTIVKANLLEILVRNDSSDITSPKIYFEHGYEFHKKRYKSNELGKVIWYAGAKIDWDNIIGKHIGVDHVDKGQHYGVLETDYATGACMFVRREVFKKIGLFDEKYFLYFEDMDFCLRAKKAGFKIIYNPEGVVWHKNAMSTGGSGSKIQDYYYSKSRLLFALKHAKIRTKIAIFREMISKSTNITKRMALIDFFLLKFNEKKFDI